MRPPAGSVLSLPLSIACCIFASVLAATAVVPSRAVCAVPGQPSEEEAKAFVADAKSKGFAHLEKALDVEVISRFREAFESKYLSKILAMLKTKGLLMKEFRYKETMSRKPGRMDIQYGIKDNSFEELRKSVLPTVMPLVTPLPQIHISRH